MSETITQDLLDQYALWMDDDIREQVHDELSPCTPQEFCDRYAELDPEGWDIIRKS